MRRGGYSDWFSGTDYVLGGIVGFTVRVGAVIALVAAALTPFYIAWRLLWKPRS